jgi:hypothetical protein
MSKKNISRRGKSSNTQKIWRSHIGAWEKSGLSRAEYCRQNILSPHALGYWHKKYNKPNSAGMTLVPVPIAGKQLHEVKEPQTRSAELKVEISNRFKIVVPDGFTAATLARLITTLEAC